MAYYLAVWCQPCRNRVGQRALGERCALAAVVSESKMRGLLFGGSSISLKVLRVCGSRRPRSIACQRYLKSPLSLAIGCTSLSLLAVLSLSRKAVLVVFCRKCGYPLAGTALFSRVFTMGVFMFRRKAFAL